MDTSVGFLADTTPTSAHPAIRANLSFMLSGRVDALVHRGVAFTGRVPGCVPPWITHAFTARANPSIGSTAHFTVEAVTGVVVTFAVGTGHQLMGVFSGPAGTHSIHAVPSARTIQRCRLHFTVGGRIQAVFTGLSKVSHVTFTNSALESSPVIAFERAGATLCITITLECTVP